MAGEEIEISPESVVELWREICVPAGLPDVPKLTPKRRQKVVDRLAVRDDGAQRDLAWVRRYFEEIVSMPFCLGDGGRGWRASFDFAMRSEEIVVNIFQGAYRDAPPLGGELRIRARSVMTVRKKEAPKRTPSVKRGGQAGWVIRKEGEPADPDEPEPELESEEPDEPTEMPKTNGVHRK